MALPQSNESKWCRWNSKQCRPWSDCSSRSSLIWVCTVCLDISVWKLRIITLHHKKRPFWACLNNCAPRPQPLYIQCIHSQWIQCIHSWWTVHEMFGKYFILFYWLKLCVPLSALMKWVISSPTTPQSVTFDDANEILNLISHLNPYLAVRDICQAGHYQPWLLFKTYIYVCRFPWGTQGPTRRRHVNNDPGQIDHFIGCEDNFPI